MTQHETLKLTLVLSLVAALGCGDDSAPMDSGTDTSTPPSDSGTDTSMPPGDSGTDAGTTGFAFRTEMPGDYTRVDRMGMPAVATALIPSAKKDEYNSVDPTDGFATGAGAACADLVSCRWAGDYVASITAIHELTNSAGMNLNQQLMGLGLTACADGGACATQPIAAGAPPVASLVIPDVLTIDTTATAGFPNGRKLSDPAMDITISVILLDLSVHTPATFTDLDGDGTPGPSLNPLANDVAFGTTFPYVADPHTAP